MVEEGSEAVGNGGEHSQESGDGGLEQTQVEGEVLKNLLEYLAQNLVTKPEAVEVTESDGEDASVLELRVDKGDLGRVIGKQGRTAKSLRTILNAAASRANRRVSVEIVED
tara:strand:- start:466 stop:798 length:333 start_codon:yes stop_codon:yes gene_type:complete